MKHNKDRCDHCGKWVTIQHSALFTLYDMANGHPESESVGVCMECSDKYSPEHWYAWLDKRFPPGGHWEAGRYIAPGEANHETP